jgi:hypothetical protein
MTTARMAQKCGTKYVPKKPRNWWLSGSETIHFWGANPPAWKVKAQMPNGPQAAPTPTVSASGPSELRTKSGKNEFNPVQPIIRNALNAHDSCCNEKSGKKHSRECIFPYLLRLQPCLLRAALLFFLASPNSVQLEVFRCHL